MELVFQENRVEYLCSILCETINQEQTADVVIPDSYPDAERVIDAFGTLLVRSEECGAGSASVAGFVQAGVIYAGPEGQPRKVQVQIPFSLRKEFAPQDSCILQCSCSLLGVDARVLNSRKILVRAGISCTMRVYAPREFTGYDILDPAPAMQLKRRQIPMQMPLAVGEKSFVLNEELELPSDKPEIAHLLKCLYHARIHEQKMVGNKAVFKGSVQVHALYESGDESLHSHDWTLPFSQYAELDRQLDECQARTVLTLTGADTEPDGQLDSRRLLSSINLLAQCTAVGVQTISLIEDAYCTDADFTPKWEESRMNGILDRQSYRETATVEKELPVKSVVDIWAYPKEAVRQRIGQRVQTELPLSCNVLYYDETGALQQKNLQTSVTVETELAENGQCAVADVDLGEAFYTVGNGTLAVKIPVAMELECSAEHQLRRVCGGEVSPLAQREEAKPAVLLRFTDGPEEIWDIAKTCRTSVENILSANELSENAVPANTLLLIPM